MLTLSNLPRRLKSKIYSISYFSIAIYDPNRLTFQNFVSLASKKGIKNLQIPSLSLTTQR